MSQEDNYQDDSIVIDTVTNNESQEERTEVPIPEAEEVAEVVSEGEEAISEAVVSQEKTEEKADSTTSKESPMVPAEQALSNKLYLIPVSGRPIFPGIFTPLIINSEEDIKVIDYEEIFRVYDIVDRFESLPRGKQMEVLNFIKGDLNSFDNDISIQIMKLDEKHRNMLQTECEDILFPDFNEEDVNYSKVKKK